jgi:hypothetical protein
VGSFLLLLHSIEPRHLTNQSHPCVPWANEFLLIVEYCIHHIIINIHDDDDVMEQKHDLSGGDAHVQSDRCALPRRSSVLGAGSWRPFWFDHIFCSMIFGRVMANIRHGGGSRTVAFRPFSEVVQCGVCVFFGSDVEEVKKPVPLFYECHLF